MFFFSFLISNTKLVYHKDLQSGAQQTKTKSRFLKAQGAYTDIVHQLKPPLTNCLVNTIEFWRGKSTDLICKTEDLLTLGTVIDLTCCIETPYIA